MLYVVRVLGSLRTVGNGREGLERTQLSHFSGDAVRCGCDEGGERRVGGGSFGGGAGAERLGEVSNLTRDEVFKRGDVGFELEEVFVSLGLCLTGRVGFWVEASALRR